MKPVGTVLHRPSRRYIEHKFPHGERQPAVGDVVFFDGAVWLVRGKGLEKDTLTLGLAYPDRLEVVNDCVQLHHIVFLFHAANLMSPEQPVITDYVTWRAVFGTLIGHITRVLQDEKRLTATAQADDVLSWRIANLAKLSDPYMRATRLQMCHMNAARNILWQIPHAVLRVPN
jgi:hypothetical protein